MSGRRRGGVFFQPGKELVAALDPSWTTRKCCETQNPALRGMLEGDLPRHLKCQSGRGCIQRYGTKLLFAGEKPEEYVDDDEEDAFAYISAPPPSRQPPPPRLQLGFPQREKRGERFAFAFIYFNV